MPLRIARRCSQGSWNVTRSLGLVAAPGLGTYNPRLPSTRVSTRSGRPPRTDADIVSETSSCKHRTQAGAVHAMWLVSIMILWLGTLALLYVTDADIARIESDALDGRVDLMAANVQRDELYDQLKGLSDAVGYVDPANLSSRTNAAALAVDIDAAKASVGVALGDVESQVTVDQTIKALLVALQGSRTALQASESTLTTAQAARDAATRLTADNESNYNDQIDQLRTDLADEQQRGITQANNYDRRIQDLTDQQQSADDSARSLQTSLDVAQADAAREQADAAALLGAIAAHRAPIAPEATDGRVQAVSGDGALVWLDIGSQDGLAVGTRFEVLRPSKNGELVSKGEVEVRTVEADGCTAGLLGKAVLLDPVLPGDVVRSPIFSARRVLHYHLLGEFPISLSKEFVEARLAEHGGVVDGSISETTDVLVLGQKNLSEGEFAVELEDTDEYRKADKWGMRIVRLADLASFLGS